MFRRILIANRGEVAARVLRTCRRLGVEAFVACSQADLDAPYVAEAAGVVCVGPAAARRSYLDRVALVQAAVQVGAAALHPGWGFLSQDAVLADLCREHGVTFVGPSGRVHRLMGRKLRARRVAREAGLEVIPGSDELVASAGEARAVADRVGYPVLLKADAGGGGRGMRRVDAPGDMDEAFELCRAEAEAAFGHAGLYLERFLEGGRHVEVQVLGDAYGRAVHLGERECSLQRKHQKLVEESPSPALDAAAGRAVGERAARAAAAIGYQGAGTIELLLDRDGSLRFMEMNTRLQVEHTVTEERTGLDLVELQLRVACNEPLPLRQEDVRLTGHAVEVRLNAEDPDDGFRPSPGRLERVVWPDGARVDTHVRAGYVVPPHYDSLLAKLIVRGDDRASCVARLQAALDAVAIEGVKTTLPLLRRIARSEAFVSGRYDTAWLPAFLVGSRR